MFVNHDGIIRDSYLHSTHLHQCLTYQNGKKVIDKYTFNTIIKYTLLEINFFWKK